MRTLVMKQTKELQMYDLMLSDCFTERPRPACQKNQNPGSMSSYRSEFLG